MYRPLFSPWLTPGFQARIAVALAHSLVTADRFYILQQSVFNVLNVPGEVWECGVYRGGTALFLADLLEWRGSGKILRLFDTFTGLPPVDPSKDWHVTGEFSDCSLPEVRKLIGREDRVRIHPGLIPETFQGLEMPVALAHIDVDLYSSVMAALAHIYPRMSIGGVIVLDDYGFATCPGAKEAVDQFFADKPEAPICLPTGQALVTRHA